jgi:hypothetical protein
VGRILGGTYATTSSKETRLSIRVTSSSNCSERNPAPWGGVIHLKEPWSAHQKYRIFGDLESRVFSYHITASHIRLTKLLYEQIPSRLTGIDNQRLASYGLIAFLILFLLGELLRASPDGKKLLDNPLPLLSTGTISNPREAKVISQSAPLIDWLMTELNYFVKERGGENYDYKREFKSPKAVGTIRDEMLKAFDKDKYRGRAAPFTLPT